tara:strand:+ start:6604 stop:7467 length:864 start_codon:yes stop_codon:yes gene_type:complete
MPPAPIYQEYKDAMKPTTFDYSLPALNLPGYEDLKAEFLANRETARPENHLNTDLSSYELCGNVDAPDPNITTPKSGKKRSLMASARSAPKTTFVNGYVVYEVYTPIGQCRSWKQSDHYLHSIQQREANMGEKDHIGIQEDWQRTQVNNQRHFVLGYGKFQTVSSTFLDEASEEAAAGDQYAADMKEDFMKPRFTFSAVLSYPSNIEGKRDTVSIVDLADISGKFTTMVVTHIDEQRKKILSYDAAELKSVLRMKNGQIHGLYEISDGPNTCYEAGIVVEKANCETF